MTSPLPTRGAPEERRLAVVLFAEVVGLSRLAETLEPAAYTNLAQGLWLKLDLLLEEQGGYVFNHIADTVMAVWGAPVASENDAQRAVQAGLTLIRTLPSYLQLVGLPEQNEQLAGLQARVGVELGTVVSGSLGKRQEYTVMGEVVRLAARLQQAAQPGQALVGESIQRLLAGRFELHPADSSAGAFVVSELAGARARYLSLDSLETVMVSREAELRRLEQFVQPNMQAGRQTSNLNGQPLNQPGRQTSSLPQTGSLAGLLPKTGTLPGLPGRQTGMLPARPSLLLVTGEAGVGKSRLLLEFNHLLDASQTQANILRARGLDQTCDVPFYLWRVAWMNYFGMREKDPPDKLRQQLLREVQKLWGNELSAITGVETAHLLAHLLGIPWPDSKTLSGLLVDPPLLRQRLFELTRELLRRMCGEQYTSKRTILIFDDLQFADSSSLSLLAWLLDPSVPGAAGSLPLLIVCAARPDFLKNHPRWQNIGLTLELGPLPVDPAMVAQAYPILRNLPREALAMIANLTDGSPYFMEELVKSLVEAGLPLTPEGSEAVQAYLRAHIPETLRGLIQSRLDSLSHEARAVALLAAVVGRVFWVGAVVEEAMVADPQAGQSVPGSAREVIERLVQGALRQLIRAELAFPRANTSYSLGQEYIFKHNLLREVAYSLIPDRHLAHYHRTVANWLTAQPSADLRSMAAEHFERAGDNASAARQYQASAELAFMVGDSEQAHSLLEKAKRLQA